MGSPSINTPSYNNGADGDNLSTALLSSTSVFSDSNGHHHGHKGSSTLSREEFNSNKMIQQNGKKGTINFRALRIDKSLDIPTYVYGPNGSANALYSTHRASVQCDRREQINAENSGNIADLHAIDLDELEFCLKIFELDAIDSTSMLQGVYENLMKIKKLDHDNLAIIYAVNLNVDKHSGTKRVEILSPWYSGGSLYDVILMSPKDTPFAMHVIKRMVLQIALFMDWLHSKCQIVHGHLKSRNILFDTEFNVCVTDIGLSGLKNTMTILCPECCFDGYWMDREYFQGKSLKKKSDVWAFGFILYELVAKRQPFEGVQDINYIKKCIVNNSDMPQMPRHCDPFLSDLVKQCWNTQRSDRPTFRQIVDQIQTQMS